MYQNKIRNEKTWLEDLPGIVNRKFPPRLASDVLKYWKPNEEKINKYCKKDMGVYIWGDIGTGKTILAAQVLMQRLKMDYLEYKAPYAGFVDASNLLVKIKASYNDSQITEAEILDKYINIDYLVIDDMGVEKLSEWQISIMYNIINNRYEYLRYTSFTSNLDIETLANVYNDYRIARRIDSMCGIVKKIPF